MSRPTTLLITGLTMAYSKTMNPQMDTVKFGKMLVDSMSTLNNVPGLYHHIFDLDPSAPSDSPESTDALRKLIRQGPPSGGHWDLHLIGAGVRLISPLTPLLEDVLNTTATASAGKTKLLFSANGADHWDVVKRGCPALEMGNKPALA